MHTEHKMMTVQSMLEAASGGGAYPCTEISPGSYVLSRHCRADHPNCFFFWEGRASQQNEYVPRRTHVSLLSHPWEARGAGGPVRSSLDRLDGQAQVVG